MSRIEWVSLYAVCCYDKYTDSVTLSINIGVTSIWKYINSMRRQWNSTTSNRMHEWLKLGPFSSSTSSGLGMRLSNPKLCMAAPMSHQPSAIPLHNETVLSCFRDHSYVFSPVSFWHLGCLCFLFFLNNMQVDSPASTEISVWQLYALPPQYKWCHHVLLWDEIVCLFLLIGFLVFWLQD